MSRDVSLPMTAMSVNPVAPEVSVVIPAYNAALYISDSIESILNQSFRDFELILIDDCSTDSTLKLMRDYEYQDPRVKVFFNPKNLGIAGNRNYGVQLANGKYLAWQDADDISKAYRLADQYEFMEKNLDVGIVGGAIKLFNEIEVLGFRYYPVSDSELRKMIYRCSPIAQPTAMIRLQLLREVGPYDLKLPPAEDLDMTFRLAMQSKLANLPKVLVDYRVSPYSATANSLRVMELNTIKIRDKYLSIGVHRRTASDWIFNKLHFLSLRLIPASLKVWIFNKIRNNSSAFEDVDNRY